jgi:hypothetical protein
LNRKIGFEQTAGETDQKWKANTGTPSAQFGMGLTASFSISAFLYLRRSLGIRHNDQRQPGAPYALSDAQILTGNQNDVGKRSKRTA